MKKLLTLSLFAAIFITACTKENVNKNSTTNVKNDTTAKVKNDTTAQVVLLSKLIDNTPGSPTNGQIISQFTYNGKQLVKAVSYNSPTEFETDVFNYNSVGQLTGTTLSTSSNGVVTPVGLNGESSSKITFTGDNITEIKYYNEKNVMDDDVTFTWQNGYVTKIVEKSINSATNFTYSGTTVFRYDSNNHNTKNIYTYTENNNGKINSEADTSINNTFDNKTNIFTSQPYGYTYFFNAHSSNDFSTFNYGTNNVLNISAGGGFFEDHSYQYNSYGLPSSEAVTVFQSLNKVNTQIASGILGYEYIQVK